MDNTDVFLAHQLENISTKEKVREVLMQFMGKFLLAVQDCIDYEKTIEVAIHHNIHQMIIEDLFE